MGIFDFLRRDAEPVETRAMSSALLPPSLMSTASAVTTGDALGLAMVYRAINIHAISTKQMSLHVYRDDVKITEPSFVKSPDVNISRSAFMEQTVTAMACTGNAYWEITRDQAGRVMNLQNLNPLMVTIESNLAGQVTKYLYKDRELMPSKVKHLSLLRVPGGKYGLGPIQAAQAELRGAIDTRDYSSNWFSGSGIPSGILKSDQVLAPDQAQAAKEAWNATAGASNGVAVLGNGLTYTPIFLSPADAQFIDSQNFNVTQVARLFGIPASMLLAAVDGTSMTYTNIESEWISYIRFSLMSYLIEIEDALSSFLPRGQKAKFNIESLLRTDTKTRYESYKTALEAGFMTVEEIRKLEDLPTTGTVTENVA